MNNFRKAEKVYGKVHSYFRTKDAKNNFQKEDETEERYIALTKDLDTLHKTTLSNICVIQSKLKDWKNVIKFADEALSVDSHYLKAQYHKGRALVETLDYAGAIEVLQGALAADPSNAEVRRELARAEAEMKRYQDREQKMFQRMF